MKHPHFILFFILIFVGLVTRLPSSQADRVTLNAKESADLAVLALPGKLSGYPLQFVPFAQVKLKDSLWQPILERNRTVTIPHLLKLAEETGVLRNFDRAAGRQNGFSEGLSMNDETAYKAIEAMALELTRRPDPMLARQLDALVERIAAAQEPNGYLHTPYQIAKRQGKPVPAPFSDNGRGLELYFAGQLWKT